MAHVEFGEDQGVSVYLVHSDVEEAVVAAALCLPRQASLSQPVSFLRVQFSDLPAAVDVQETPGTTGLGLVDGRHRDLFGTVAGYAEITRTLRSRFVRGEAVLRQVAGVGFVERFSEFLVRDDLTDQGRKAIHNYLKR